MSEANDIAKIAAQTKAGDHLGVVPGDTFTVATPAEWDLHLVDTEALEDQPRRHRGTVNVHDAASFVEQVQRRADSTGYEEVGLYADETTTRLVAILNDDTAAVTGWRDYRVEVVLRRRPEWELWLKHSGDLLGQEAFAELTEEGLPEIVEPSAADMLDLAQNFSASTTGKYRGGAQLASGARQFVADEEIEATAGASGNLVIPAQIKLGIAPFYGSERFEVGARFRYRLNRSTGELTLGYIIDRPHEVERAAFATVRNTVADGLGLTAIAGPAPAQATPATLTDLVIREA